MKEFGLFFSERCAIGMSRVPRDIDRLGVTQVKRIEGTVLNVALPNYSLICLVFVMLCALVCIACRVIAADPNARCVTQVAVAPKLTVVDRTLCNRGKLFSHTPPPPVQVRIYPRSDR